MSTSFTLTREQFRDAVLRKLRVLGADRTPEAEEEAIVVEALDVRLKELHRLGVLWWKVSSTLTDVALVAGTATANAPADILYPVTLSIRSGADDHPVAIVDHRRFQEIPTKADTGTPEMAVLFGGVFRFYPVPDSGYTAKLTYQKIVDDSAASTPPDAITAALRWLKDLVAYDCADDFRVPEQRMVRLERESERAERKLRALFPQRIDTLPVEAAYF